MVQDWRARRRLRRSPGRAGREGPPRDGGRPQVRRVPGRGVHGRERGLQREHRGVLPGAQGQRRGERESSGFFFPKFFVFFSFFLFRLTHFFSFPPSSTTTNNKQQQQQVDYVFVDHPSYPRPGGGFYSDAAGSYGDNQFRFALLSLAALEAPLRLRAELPEQFGPDAYDPDSCVFVANDWHAAMVPVYVASRFRPHGVYRGARTVTAIHNLIHQGVFPPSTFESLGVPGNWYGAMEWQYPPHQRMGSYEEEGRAINTLKAALTTADRIVTVSPGYAWEITTPEGGCGLESLLGSRSYVLDGVLNGVDVEEWSPATDKHLYKKYDASTVEEGKAANKAALQKELGLPIKPDAPLFAFIGRLDPQKGADLVLMAAPWLVSQGAQVVLLGSGDPRLEDGLRSLEAAHPESARAWVGFNVPFSHRLTAAADVLLMPSVFEPCGLNQMYAFLAGTPVVAHATGGLRDTVVPYDPLDETNGSTGWTFSPCNAEAFIAACGHALTMYRDHPDAFGRLRARCMARDCSWDGSAAQWEQIFDWSKSDPPYCP